MAAQCRRGGSRPARLIEVSHEIETIAAGDDRARKPITVPGIGPLVATAIEVIAHSEP